MSFLHTLAAFILALGVLVIVHELGHYLVARWCGVKVLRFSVGFGRALLVRRLGRDRTEWVISALPLGGYVSMLDERELPAGTALAPDEAARAFNRQSPLRRMAIVIAGPAANLLLAVVLYAALFMSGTVEPRARLAEPEAATAAAQAGFRADDEIVAIDGGAVRSWTDARWMLMQAAADARRVEIGVVDGQGRPVVRVLDLSAAGSETIESGFPTNIGFVLHAPQATIGRVEPGSAAERAGLVTGDMLVALDGRPIVDTREAVGRIKAAAGQALRLTVLRGDAELTLAARPAAIEETDASGGRRTVGRLGVAIVPRLDTVTVRYAPLDAFAQGAARTWEMSVFSLRMFGRMVVGQMSLKNLSGPVTIADYAGQSARLGLDAYVGFIALISISLGVLNLLPIPMLDGGHLLYYSAELIKGRPLSQRFIELSQRVGLGVLIALMAIALVNDISRQFA